ncbi:cochaperone protein [Penicillium ochrochloron]
MNAAAEGDKALAASNAPLAIQHYTRALIELPRAPSYYLQRAIARSRVKPADGGPKSREALQDSEIALSLARERGKRELILSAQMRRGVALFQLERYGDAKFLFELIESRTSGEKEAQSKADGVKAAMADGASSSKKNGYGAELPIWMAKVGRKLGELSEGDEKGVVSVVEYPTDTRVPTEKELKAEWESLKSGSVVGDKVVQEKGQKDPVSFDGSSDQTKTETKVVVEASPAVVAQKVRHEWYQSQDSVVVTLYVKGIPKDKVETELKDDSVSLQFPLPSGSGYDFTLDPLYAPIDPSTSKVSVMSTKIELTLQKKTSGQKWGSLEGSPSTTKIADRPVAPPAPASAGPAYPTSSRHGAKDWDKLASSLTAKESKEASKNTENDEDGNVSDAESLGSEYGGDAVDGFFKKLYAGADPDTRRAMMKSYIESQGTSLSTNWSEVGSKKMEPHPST